ncbi:hypothetical protein C9224_23625, partial [Escherichia coli]
MLPSETMIWQPEFTDKTLSRKPGAVQNLKQALFRLSPSKNSQASTLVKAVAIILEISIKAVARALSFSETLHAAFRFFF